MLPTNQSPMDNESVENGGGIPELPEGSDLTQHYEQQEEDAELVAVQVLINQLQGGVQRWVQVGSLQELQEAQECVEEDKENGYMEQDEQTNSDFYLQLSSDLDDSETRMDRIVPENEPKEGGNFGFITPQRSFGMTSFAGLFRSTHHEGLQEVRAETNEETYSADDCDRANPVPGTSAGNVQRTGRKERTEKIPKEAVLSSPTSPVEPEADTDSEVEIIGEVIRGGGAEGNSDKQEKTLTPEPGQSRYILLFTSGDLEEIVKETDQNLSLRYSTKTAVKRGIDEGKNEEANQNRRMGVSSERTAHTSSIEPGDDSNRDVRFIREVIGGGSLGVSSDSQVKRHLFIEVPQRTSEKIIIKGMDDVKSGTSKTADSVDSNVGFLGETVGKESVGDNFEDSFQKRFIFIEVLPWRNRERTATEGGQVETETSKAADRDDSEEIQETAGAGHEEDAIDEQEESSNLTPPVGQSTPMHDSNSSDTGASTSGWQGNANKRPLTSPMTDDEDHKKPRLTEKNCSSCSYTGDDSNDSNRSSPIRSPSHSEPELVPLDLSVNPLRVYSDYETDSSDAIVYEPPPVVIPPPELYTPNTTASYSPEQQEMVDFLSELAAYEASINVADEETGNGNPVNLNQNVNLPNPVVVESPDSPDSIGFPDSPAVPYYPYMIDSPDSSDSPDIPDSPDTPVIPDSPASPDSS